MPKIAGSISAQLSRLHLQERADLRAGERDDVGRVEQAAVEPVDLLGAEEAAVLAHLGEQLAERLGEDGGAAVGGLRQAVEDALRQEARVLSEQAEHATRLRKWATCSGSCPRARRPWAISAK